ncbi:hypothetical protein ACTWJ8_02540 [Streptomyces sp. SDT5-1]|uniref:hypothetical protein n=1 Tax=Streptomyces sp. SDT5-1 TaxID=3406418 RepID=UPI003FCF3411
MSSVPPPPTSSTTSAPSYRDRSPRPVASGRRSRRLRSDALVRPTGGPSHVIAEVVADRLAPGAEDRTAVVGGALALLQKG